MINPSSWTYGDLSDDTQRYALHIIQQISLRRRDERLMRPQQRSVIIPIIIKKQAEQGAAAARSVAETWM
jgi:hypothetical protein